MTPDPVHMAHARQVANAVLYEGYLLYPYRQSAQKNRTRFQFGVLMPPGYRSVDDSEPSACQTECLVECSDDAQVEMVVRFLHFQRRTVQRIAADTGEISDVDTLWVDGTEYTSWDEALEREQCFRVSVADLLGKGTDLRFRIGAGEELEDLTGARDRRPGGWSAAGNSSTRRSGSGPSASPGPTRRCGFGCGWRTAARRRCCTAATMGSVTR